MLLKKIKSLIVPVVLLLSILMTGFPELGDCIDALGVGIQEILLKPISPDEILRVARETLSEK